MAKKHVFALSLALFTAGVFYTANDAEAQTKRYHQTHYVKKQKSLLSYFKSTTSAANHKAAVTKTQKTKVVSRKTKKTMASHHAKKPPTRVAKKTMDRVDALAVEPVTVSRRSGGIIGVADDYLGMSEHRNKRQLQGLFNFAYTGRVDPARTPWCAAFANGVLKKSGKRGTNSMMATSFLNWGKKTYKPAQGDVVVLKPGRRYHVGFYMGTVMRNGVRYVKVLGGNQNNTVRVTYYKASRVIAYRTAA